MGFPYFGNGFGVGAPEYLFGPSSVQAEKDDQRSQSQRGISLSMYGAVWGAGLDLVMVEAGSECERYFLTKFRVHRRVKFSDANRKTVRSRCLNDYNGVDRAQSRDRRPIRHVCLRTSFQDGETCLGSGVRVAFCHARIGRPPVEKQLCRTHQHMKSVTILIVNVAT